MLNKLLLIGIVDYVVFCCFCLFVFFLFVFFQICKHRGRIGLQFQVHCSLHQSVTKSFALKLVICIKVKSLFKNTGVFFQRSGTFTRGSMTLYTNYKLTSEANSTLHYYRFYNWCSQSGLDFRAMSLEFEPSLVHFHLLLHCHACSAWPSLVTYAEEWTKTFYFLFSL